MSVSTTGEESIAGLSLDDLGVLPEVAAEINRVAEQPDATVAQVVDLIVRDPTLSAKVLRFLNSAFYGLRHPVRSIEHATAYLGIAQIRNLVLSSSLVDAFPFDHGIVDPRTIWEHSLGCAIIAKRLAAEAKGVHPDEAYLGGLLHDVGRILLLSRRAERYAAVVNVGERGLCSIRDAEASEFGISHEEAGYRLGHAWGFDEGVLAMIRWHHRPERAGELAPHAALVGFANSVVHQARMRFGFELDDELAIAEQTPAWELLCARCPDYAALEPARIQEIAGEAVHQTKALVEASF